MLVLPDAVRCPRSTDTTPSPPNHTSLCLNRVTKQFNQKEVFQFCGVQPLKPSRSGMLKFSTPLPSTQILGYCHLCGHDYQTYSPTKCTNTHDGIRRRPFKCYLVSTWPRTETSRPWVATTGRDNQNDIIWTLLFITQLSIISISQKSWT